MSRISIEDPSPLKGVYEGDLKYGRCLGIEYRKQKDYVAQRDGDGNAINKPVVGLVPAFKRDETYWRGRNKHPKIKRNPDGVADSILVAAYSQHGGLLDHVSRLKSGNQTVLARR